MKIKQPSIAMFVMSVIYWLAAYVLLSVWEALGVISLGKLLYFPLLMFLIGMLILVTAAFKDFLK